MEDSAIHRLWRSEAVLGRGVFFKLCQKLLIVPKLCKTRLAHSPWGLLQLYCLLSREIHAQGPAFVALGHLSTDLSFYLEF